MFAKHFGCCRWFYNYALALKIESYKREKKVLSIYDLSGLLPELKRELGWLKEVSAKALQMSLIPMEAAYKRFFREKFGFPKFKSKHNKQSFQVYENVNVDWENNKISIPKIKNIKIKLSRSFEGQMRTTTISKTITDKYFISILVEDEKLIPKKKEIINSIGIDVGLISFATLSNGEKVRNRRFLKKKQGQLKRAQRKASKKKKGSKNRKKANKKTAIIHEKINNQRKDFLHKLSSRLINENQVIAIEDLKVKNMQKNHKLAQAIGDVSWYEFRRQLEYKAEWYGVQLIKVNPAYTSKTCYNCGYINENLILKDRHWVCPNCKSALDRDINAAKNILGRASPEVKPVEKILDLGNQTKQSSVKQEVLSTFR